MVSGPLRLISGNNYLVLSVYEILMSFYLAVLINLLRSVPSRLSN